MLGIRHYAGSAIDLWQGEISDFDCDLQSRDIRLGLIDAQVKAKRHLVYVPDEDAHDTMAAIKEFLDDRVAGGTYPKRITVILSDADQYKTYQSELFSVFPES